MATFTHGRVATLKLNDVGAVLRDFTPAAYNATLDLQRDTSEVSAFGNAFKDYLVGQYGATLQFDMHYDATLVGYLFALFTSTAAGVKTNVQFVVDGTATKYASDCFVTSISPKSSISSQNDISVTLQLTGAITLS